MTDYEYILERITKHDEFHWDNGVVEGIISKTGLLSDEELCDIMQAIEDHKSWDLTYWPDYITSWNWEVCYKISKSVMKKISTHKLIDLFYTKSPDTCCYRSSLSMWILHDTRSELRRRYNCGIDSYLIARVFIDANDENIHTFNDKVRYEFGARAVAKFQYPIAKNIEFNTKLELFSNYLKNPQYIDVDWQNMLVLKVNDWLNANLSTHLIYDYDIPFPDVEKGSKVQFKEVLAIGFMVNLK